MNNEGAARLSASKVAFGAGGQFVIEPEIPDARVFGNAVADRVAPVIHNHQFQVPVVLTLETMNCLWNKTALVTGRHDETNQWLGGVLQTDRGRRLKIRRLLRQWLPDPNQLGGSEVRALISPAMRTVIGFGAAQPRSTEIVLIKPLAGCKAPGFVQPATRSEWGAPDESGAGPHPAPSGPRRANVVIHLPARPQPIILIRRADLVDHLAPHGVTEVRQTVERLQRPALIAEPLGCFPRRARNLGHRATGVRKNSLFIPGVIRGGTGKTIGRIGVERHDQPFKPVGSDARPTFE